MLELQDYELDFVIAMEYFYTNLNESNALSSSLLKFVDFNSGKFFALLPNETDPTKINDFRCGGIAKAVRTHISSVVLSKMKLSPKLGCIIDDVTAAFKSNYQEPLFDCCGLVYDKEIYYILTQKTATIELIDQCFLASNAIWHSLCVLTSIDFKDKGEKTLSLQKMEEISLNTQMIILGAYDGEGYIFWENSED